MLWEKSEAVNILPHLNYSHLRQTSYKMFCNLSCPRANLINMHQRVQQSCHHGPQSIKKWVDTFSPLSFEIPAIIQFDSGSKAIAVGFIQVENQPTAYFAHALLSFSPACSINFLGFIYKRSRLKWMPVNVPFSFDSRILVIINDVLLSRKEECHALSARTRHYSVREENRC